MHCKGRLPSQLPRFLKWSLERHTTPCRTIFRATIKPAIIRDRVVAWTTPMVFPQEFGNSVQQLNNMQLRYYVYDILLSTKLCELGRLYSRRPSDKAIFLNYWQLNVIPILSFYVNWVKDEFNTVSIRLRNSSFLTLFRILYFL